MKQLIIAAAFCALALPAHAQGAGAASGGGGGGGGGSGGGGSGGTSAYASHVCTARRDMCVLKQDTPVLVSQVGVYSWKNGQEAGGGGPWTPLPVAHVTICAEEPGAPGCYDPETVAVTPKAELSYTGNLQYKE